MDGILVGVEVSLWRDWGNRGKERSASIASLRAGTERAEMRLARDTSRGQPAGPDHLWKSLWAVLGSEAGMGGVQGGSPRLPSPSSGSPWAVAAGSGRVGGRRLPCAARLCPGLWGDTLALVPCQQRLNFRQQRDGCCAGGAVPAPLCDGAVKGRVGICSGCGELGGQRSCEGGCWGPGTSHSHVAVVCSCPDAAFGLCPRVQQGEFSALSPFRSSPPRFFPLLFYTVSPSLGCGALSCRHR